MVERCLAKADIAGPNPVSRSSTLSDRIGYFFCVQDSDPRGSREPPNPSPALSVLVPFPHECRKKFSALLCAVVLQTKFAFACKKLTRLRFCVSMEWCKLQMLFVFCNSVRSALRVSRAVCFVVTMNLCVQKIHCGGASVRIGMQQQRKKGGEQ